MLNVTKQTHDDCLWYRVLGAAIAVLFLCPFLAVNADILTDLDLAAIFQEHREEDLATLVLHDYPPYNNVWIDGEEKVIGFGRPPDIKTASALAYTGVQVVSPRMLEWLRSTARAEGCSAIDLDSGVQRHRAHRFYFDQGMYIACHHFVEQLT